jgi:hypothetical protein
LSFLNQPWPVEARAAIVALAFVCIAPWSASGQSTSGQSVRAERPFRGLFGAAEEPERGQSVSLDWGVLGGYDDNLAADQMATTDSRQVVGGKYGSVNGTLAYSARNLHHSFSASATSSGRYYPDLHALNAIDGGGGVAFTADIGRRTKIDLTQFFSYQPYYGINFIGGVVPSDAAIADVTGSSSQAALNSSSSYSLDGRTGLTHSLGARSSLRGDYSYRSLQFSGGDESFNWQLASAAYLRNLTRYATLRIGYGYGVGKNSVATASPSIVNHNLDLGIDYNRQLSFSRRTRLNFSSGSTGVVDRNSTRYHVIGTAGLTQEIGRTWRANASYNRGVQYLPGFDSSFFADTAQVRLAGLIGRRVEASASGGYSSGQLGFDTTGGSYSSSTAGADVRVAMSRTLSFFAQYAYYRYGFDTGVQVPFGLPPQLDRQSIRIGISGWLPLVRH